MQELETEICLQRRSRMNITRAKESYIPQIIDLLKDIGMIHHSGRDDVFRANIIKYSSDEIQAVLHDENNPLFVVLAEDQETVLAYVFCKVIIRENSEIFQDRKILFIDDLCVSEELRGQNIGGKLLEFLKGYAREISAHSLELNVWEFNESAIKFYEREGFYTQKRQMEFDL